MQTSALISLWTRRLRSAVVSLIVGFAVTSVWAAGSVTFTPDGTGTFPGTLKFDSSKRLLTVDLSSVPGEAKIFRAELVLKPVTSDGHHRPVQPTCVYPAGQPERKLKFVGPRFVSLDALEAVTEALNAKRPLTFHVENTCRGVERLELSGDLLRPRHPEQLKVSNLQLAHRTGQTFLTFREPTLEPFPEFKTGGDVRAWAKRGQEQHAGLTFRIWRADQPVTATTIQRAQLVGECARLTCWDSGYHQDETDRRPPVRFRVTDHGEPVPWGTGIYAHNPAVAGPAFYAVTVALHGEEDFGQLGDGNTTTEPLTESVGPGVPILQWTETPQEWMYRRAADGSQLMRMVYTRWESWPRSPVPSKPIDYLVVSTRTPRPATPIREPEYRAYRVAPAPVGLHLHCWGGSLNGGYGWWYNAHRGAVLIASNQVPYDWWTGHHEALGTCKTWGDGHVQPFTMDRMFAFLDWAAQQWQRAPENIRPDWPRLDLTRVFTAGSSMGGSGAPMYAIRHGQQIAWALGWVGVHVPDESPQFRSSYANNYGPRDAQITMPDGQTSPWDYFDDVWWLTKYPQLETGLVLASNGKNDGGIGWPQAVRFARALQETRRPHVFNWGLGGHGTRTLVGANFDLDVRTDQSLPAFTHCTLDNNLGTARARSPEELGEERRRQEREVQAGRAREVAVDPYDGDPRGALNAHLAWETNTIVDRPDGWEMTVVLADSAPQDRCRVDLTPRRLQQFRTPPGAKFTYTVTRGTSAKELASGAAVADEFQLLTLRQIPLEKGGNRVRIAIAR
jgi:hypothetical protein